MKTPENFNLGKIREDLSNEIHEKIGNVFPQSKAFDQHGHDFDKANRSVAMQEEKIKRIKSDIADLGTRHADNKITAGEDVPFDPSEDIDPDLIKLQKELIIAQDELTVLKNHANKLDPQVN